MRRRFSLGVAVLALAAVLVLAGRRSLADEPGPAPKGTMDFTGKVLIITTKTPDKTGGTLEKVEVKQLGNQTFLVGQVADRDNPDNPYKDVAVKVWVPVNQVVQILEFDSLDEARKLYTRFGK